MAPPNIPADFDFLDPTSTSQVCPSRSSPSCASPSRSTGSTCRAAPAASTTRATGSSPSTPTSRRCPSAATSSRSSQNGAIPTWPQGDDARRRSSCSAPCMLNMDAPHHTRLRKIISRGFTPRAIGRLEEELAQRAQNIAKTAAAEGSGDFVEQVSCELPLQAIAGLLGVPQEDRDKLFRWSNEMTGGEDPEYADVDPAHVVDRTDHVRHEDGRGARQEPDRRHRHHADRGRHRRREALRRRVRLLRRSCSPWRATRPRATRSPTA